MSDLARFWPEKERLRQVLTVEAESASTAVALAVHQPVRLLRRTLGERISDVEVGEEELVAVRFGP